MNLIQESLRDNGRILVIDDDISARESLRMVLKDRYEVVLASDAQQGLAYLQEESFDLVILDIKMPGMDGITTLKEIKKLSPETEVMLLTAYASLETARDAVRYGAFDYLMKPFDKDDLLNTVRKGLEKKFQSHTSKVEQEHLRIRASLLEEQIARAKSDLIAAFEGTINALLLAIDAKDSYTNAHSRRVSELTCAIARSLGLGSSVIEGLKHASLIHDIGKIGIDERILRKQGSLSIEEYEIMKKHPEIGVTIVSAVPFLEEAIPVILHHHERYDGRGYPRGLKGKDIPLSARIVAVADAIDAMLRSRPYRGNLPEELIKKELMDNAGTQFDPLVVEVVLSEKFSII